MAPQSSFKYELVAPASPTPHELKMLSPIDSQIDNRVHVPIIMFFSNEPAMAGKDPVHVIKQALAKTLVFYYPLAGRLKKDPDGKLFVDCTGEGVIFIEADADVMLHQFGNDFYPQSPYCYDDKFLCNVPGSDQIFDSPLLLIQVTRLKCGGFVFAMRFNHSICDVTGISNFIKGLGEISCGEPKPSILPVWNRELLCARNPPRITCLHHEYEQVSSDNKSNFVLHRRSFFFGPAEIAAIRRLLPPYLKKSTSFEVLTAFIWRCRTIALKWKNQNLKIRFLCVVNARYGHCRFTNPLPDGFYGNAFAIPTAITTVGKLCNLPLEYTLKLVKKTKNEATEEYVHSLSDLLTIRKFPPYSSTGIESFEVSDMTKAGMEDVNFGWGKTISGGVSFCSLEFTPYVPYTNSEGEKGRMVLICLPKETMKNFVKQVDDMLKGQE